LLRFSPVLWEDEPRISKLNPLISSLEEELDEFEALEIPGGVPASDDKLKKLLTDLLKDSIKLESDGIAETIPISQIRHASWWARLAPSGNGKLLLIENADRMLDSARNSLLKLLEEPPGNVTIVLTSSRPGTLLPTILSRLRPYRFEERSEEIEKEVIRKVFRNKDTITVKHDDKQTNLISAYLDSFLPVPGDAINGLAAFFAASAAMKAAVLCKKRGGGVVEAVVLLGKHTAPIAEASGLGRPLTECAQVSAKVIKGADNFEIHSLFLAFLRSLLTMVSSSQKQAASPSTSFIAYNELWRECTARAESAVLTYNQSVSLALEMLFIGLSRGMADLR
jgi:DNA polymerase-3 subunit gamma/tau